MTLAIQAALAIGRKYWGHISAALAVLLLIATVRGCGREIGLRRELAACLAKPPQTITQTVTVKEKCKSAGAVTFQPGSPCPDVVWSHENESAATLTQTAQLGGSEGRIGANRGIWSLSAGAGIYQGGVYPALGGGIWTETGLGSLGLEAQALFPMAWEESQNTRRPAFTLGLTIRP